MRSKVRHGKWSPGSLLPSRRDLAKEYGVTCVTVQRAIAGLINDGTVRAHSRKGTFVSGDNSVQSLISPPASLVTRSGAAKRVTIGIVAELPGQGSSMHDGSYFETRVAVQAVERVFSEAGIGTRFVNVLQSSNNVVHVDNALETLVNDGVDGIVVVFSDEPDRAKRVYTISKDASIPLVYVSSRELSVPLPHVHFDNRDAGFQAAQHLLDQGCLDIAMVSPFVEDWASERAIGIRHAVNASDFPSIACRFYPAEPTYARWNTPGVDVGYEENKRITQAAAYECAKAILKSGDLPGGIIAASDHVAFGVIQAASEAGKVPGHDFLLIGFDDVPDSRLVNLSTLRPPLEAMGSEAANLLLSAIQGRRAAQQIKLRSHLVARGSTAATVANGMARWSQIENSPAHETIALATSQ